MPRPILARIVGSWGSDLIGLFAMHAFNVVNEAVGRLLRNAGFKKANRVTWFRRNIDTVSVLNLQRSSYGPQYYINVALWLTALGDSPSPRENLCHIRLRWEQLFQLDKESLSVLMDFENSSMTEVDRITQILLLLENSVLPFFGRTMTKRDLEDFYEENPWLISYTVADAKEFLSLDC